MKYKLIVIARELGNHAGADALLTCDPKQEQEFRKQMLFDYDGDATGELKGTTETDDCLVEYYRGIGGNGDIVITTRQVDDLNALLGHKVSGWTE